MCETSAEEEKDWPLVDPEEREGAVAGCHPCGPWGKGERPDCSHGAGLSAHLSEATVRHVFGHAAKRAQGGSGRRLTLPPVLNKRALGEKSLPVGAVSVLTLSLTVF